MTAPGRATGVVARVVALRDVGDRLVEQWRELAASAVEPNPFFEPGFVLPAARLLPDGPDAALLTAESSGELLFAVPLVRERGFRRVPIPSVRVWLHPYAFLGTPLVSQHARPDALSAALRVLRDLPGARWLVWEQLPRTGPVATLLGQALAACGVRATTFEPYERAVLHRRSSNDYLDRAISGRHLKNLRRQRRNLEAADGSEVQLLDVAAGAYDDPGPLESGTAEFLRMEAAGWKGRDGGAMAGSPSDAELFREVCRAFAADSRLQLWVWGTAGRPAAAQCNLMAGSTVFHFKIAYDEDYARYSPGLQLELAMVETFHADARLTMIDSCTAPGTRVSEQLYPDRLPVRTLLLPLSGLRGHLAARGTPLAAEGYRRGREWARREAR